MTGGKGKKEEIQSAVEAGAIQKVHPIARVLIAPSLTVGLLPRVLGVAFEQIDRVMQDWFDHSEAFADRFGRAGEVHD